MLQPQLRVWGLPQQGSREPSEKPAGLLGGLRRVAVLLRRGPVVWTDSPPAAMAAGLAAAAAPLVGLPRFASGSSMSARSMSSSHSSTRSASQEVKPVESARQQLTMDANRMQPASSASA